MGQRTRGRHISSGTSSTVGSLPPLTVGTSGSLPPLTVGTSGGATSSDDEDVIPYSRREVDAPVDASRDASFPGVMTRTYRLRLLRNRARHDNTTRDGNTAQEGNNGRDGNTARGGSTGRTKMSL